MPSPLSDSPESFEETQRALNPRRDEERERAASITAGQLVERGIQLHGDETSDELADLLSALERFEGAVMALGGDRMVNDPRSSRPEDDRFVPPKRADDEDATSYARRLTAAADRLTFRVE